ncbi:hypothetical protein ACJW8F_16375 [Plesiomonas shigelloides]|uniref:hypothetical protein n=1 Tax=Plesiomonas shigelloides TaxID=703 RepID=UPI00387F1988
MDYLINLLSFSTITTITVTGATIYLKSYLNKKGELLASREEFNELKRNLIENTLATESIKQTLQRKATIRSQGADIILSSLSEIESSLLSWSLFIYFRKRSFPDVTLIEDIGREDLKNTVQLMANYHKSISRYSVFFGDEISNIAMAWSNKAYNLLFDMEAIYLASIEYHSDKIVTDSDRIIWLTTLFNEKIQPQMLELGHLKKLLSTKMYEDLDGNA